MPPRAPPEEERRRIRHPVCRRGSQKASRRAGARSKHPRATGKWMSGRRRGGRRPPRVASPDLEPTGEEGVTAWHPSQRGRRGRWRGRDGEGGEAAIEECVVVWRGGGEGIRWG